MSERGDNPEAQPAPEQLGPRAAEVAALQPDSTNNGEPLPRPDTTPAPSVEDARANLEELKESSVEAIAEVPEAFFNFDAKAVEGKYAVMRHPSLKDRMRKAFGSSQPDVIEFIKNDELASDMMVILYEATHEQPTQLGEATKHRRLPDEFFSRATSLVQQYSENGPTIPRYNDPDSLNNSIMRSPEQAFRFAQIAALLGTREFWADERSETALDALAALPPNAVVPGELAKLPIEHRGNTKPSADQVANAVPMAARLVHRENLWQGNKAVASALYRQITEIIAPRHEKLSRSLGTEMHNPEKTFDIRTEILTRTAEHKIPYLEYHIGRHITDPERENLQQMTAGDPDTPLAQAVRRIKEIPSWMSL